MARDHSPKERQRQQLERKTARRAAYARILIVSEGSKTEPNYFREIRAAFRLHTANVEVQPSERGTAPLQVVKYAQDLFENGDRHKRIAPRAFEQVYAVFDRDEHASYFDALSLAASIDKKLRNDLKQGVRFSAVASIPCFELWLLLHFEDIRSALHRDEVLRRLKRHLPAYEKGARGAFALTRSGLDVATERARRLIACHSAHDDPEPFTAVVELVAVLRSLGTPDGLAE
jgi:hypothetical protein